MERIRKYVVVTQFDVISKHLFREAEEILEEEFKISDLRAEIRNRYFTNPNQASQLHDGEYCSPPGYATLISQFK